ncbi:hypothetical protein [Dysgonomonas sp. 520]|uniref:hypothetical protein n=1 Tax=Dysgonomonas sp. 520 TaxID=2302931 RepID=UPI0013D1D6B8|nr:hypothetical protein [Dysgonomonas sp. 520]NDW09499.1 hypothetical protein [Dysgonomonas sp. 520]
MKIAKGRKSLSETIDEWITERGAALRKAPYMRKELEDQQPKLSPEDRGAKSLRGKMARSIAEAGFSLNKPRDMDDLTEDEKEEIYKKEEEKIIQYLK